MRPRVREGHYIPLRCGKGSDIECFTLDASLGGYSVEIVDKQKTTQMVTFVPVDD